MNANEIKTNLFLALQNGTITNTELDQIVIAANTVKALGIRCGLVDEPKYENIWKAAEQIGMHIDSVRVWAKNNPPDRNQTDTYLSNKIALIKKAREDFSIGLADAKSFVEKLYQC